MNRLDVLVVGGGHAGCEATYAAGKLGCKTAMITMNPSRIGFMSCNPAIGGLAKGQLVKEIDALGGVMGMITDLSAIQYRRLNESKGPAVRSSRAQCDKNQYNSKMREFISSLPNVKVIKAEVVQIIVKDNVCVGLGIRTCEGSYASGVEEIFAKAIVITSGTFLKAIMHCGDEKSEGGRLGDSGAQGLSTSLKNLGFELKRLKTGTPPRLLKESIDFKGLEPQNGDSNPIPFSFHHLPNPFPKMPQVPCHITFTNEKTHEIIASNFHRSPMFSGAIEGIGPRYCPSIEDKVKKFRERKRHQIFLEPESLDSNEVYVNGISTSLPKDVQMEFVASIIGLEKAVFSKFGYAVEYDCIDSRGLKLTFESKDVENLYFAGQVNGTSGYEEAAAQGLVAGLNAALKIMEKSEFILRRDQAYIGVLVDDLVLRGADEPYRMFTSRAEYRLMLREDNADLRLSEIGRNLGFLDDTYYKAVEVRQREIEKWKTELKSISFSPNQAINSWLEGIGFPPLKDSVSAENLLRRQNISWSDLCDLGLDGHEVDLKVQEQIEIQLRYEGYIQRDLDLLKGMKRNEFMKIPSDLEFNLVPGLSNEVVSRLKMTRPENIGQATRMPGITPAAVANLMVYLKLRK